MGEVVNTNEGGCDHCAGTGAAVAEMGCFGPRRFERCRLCNGTGTPVACTRCKERRSVWLWLRVPLCKACTDTMEDAMHKGVRE